MEIINTDSNYENAVLVEFKFTSKTTNEQFSGHLMLFNPSDDVDIEKATKERLKVLVNEVEEL